MLNANDTILAKITQYHVAVKTGTVRGAGTDANVYIILYGERDDTGKVFLKHSKTNKNKFENGQNDEFTVDAVDIGPLKKIMYVSRSSQNIQSNFFICK